MDFHFLIDKNICNVILLNNFVIKCINLNFILDGNHKIGRPRFLIRDTARHQKFPSRNVKPHEFNNQCLHLIL